MTRISPPCSSSGRRGRAPARLEWRVPHPALPFPPPRRPDTPSARHAPACRGTAASGAAQPRSAPFFNELHQVRRERRLRLASYDHAVPFLLNDDLLAYLTLVGVRIIAPGVRTPALGPLQRGARGRFRYNQEGAQVDRRVQPGLYSRLPVIPDFRARPFKFSSSASAVSRPLLSRMIPALRCMTVWSADCTANGFSPFAFSKGASAARIVASISASGMPGAPPRFPAAYSPARRPNTSRSLRELPPSRLAPCIPPPTSPTAKSPEIVASCVSASTLTPPIM